MGLNPLKRLQMKGLNTYTVAKPFSQEQLSAVLAIPRNYDCS
jgi:hypothetical protein